MMMWPSVTFQKLAVNPTMLKKNSSAMPVTTSGTMIGE